MGVLGLAARLVFEHARQGGGPGKLLQLQVSFDVDGVGLQRAGVPRYRHLC
jgi:hypothetical protein